jgi:anthranilate synthase/aminodeoxychorismate synthase-like glutamine amidotransferase
LDKPVNKRVVFIDNLDSFSWNIVHAFASLGAEVIIVPGRTGTLSATHLIESLNPTHIILGPGPGRPEQSKLTMGLAQFALKGESPPLLGICLGHQAIGVAAGWPLTPSPLGAVHGVPENIEMKNKQLTMTRYHSLILNPNKKQVTESPLEITALDQNSQSLIMAVNHKSLPIRGVQFHPESSGSVDGIELFREFLAL